LLPLLATWHYVLWVNTKRKRKKHLLRCYVLGICIYYHPALTSWDSLMTWRSSESRALNTRCMHCPCMSAWTGTVCGRSYGHAEPLSRCRRHPWHPLWASLRGPLSVDQQERCLALREAEETFRIFLKMTVEILTLKEQEERVYGKQPKSTSGEDSEQT